MDKHPPTHINTQAEDLVLETTAKCLLRTMLVLEAQLDGQDKVNLGKAGHHLLRLFAGMLDLFRDLEYVCVRIDGQPNVLLCARVYV